MKLNKFLSLALMLVSILLISSCAVSYRSINPETYNYPTPETEVGVQISYKYDVLRSSGNKRYAEKELKEGLQMIALQISNQTDKTIRLSRDFDLYVGDASVIPLDANVLSKRLKQKVWPYYFYLLMTPLTLTYTVTTPTTVESGSWPIGYALGPGLTLINVSKASNANRQLLNNLYETDIWDRDILKGETVSGLIGIQNRDVVPIHIRKK